jgi:hypothetical protein
MLRNCITKQLIQNFRFLCAKLYVIYLGYLIDIMSIPSVLQNQKNVFYNNDRHQTLVLMKPVPLRAIAT